MNKDELRILLKKRRNSISSNNRAIIEQKIFINIRDTVNRQGFKKIAGYHPIQSEIDILPTLLTLGVEVSLPYIDKELKFSIYDTHFKLVKGSYSKVPEIIHETTPEVVFVPLLGFDKNLNRIGFGKGFYDRYIAKHPDIKFIGVAFEEQKCDEIPIEPHDQKLSGIITESRIVLNN